MIKICKDCKKEFELTEKEARWFMHMNLAVPCRCKQCRKLRKIAMEEEAKKWQIKKE